MRISDWSSDVCSSDLHARRELERANALFAKRVVSNSHVDRARTELQRLESDLRRAEAQVGEARGVLEEARVERAQLAVIDSEIAMIEAQATRMRRSEEHTSELQSLMSISYAVFCLKTK